MIVFEKGHLGSYQNEIVGEYSRKRQTSQEVSVIASWEMLNSHIRAGELDKARCAQTVHI